MAPQLVGLRDMLKVYASPFYRLGAMLEGIRTFSVVARERGLTELTSNPVQAQHLLTSMEMTCRQLSWPQPAALATHARKEIEKGRNSPAEVQVFLSDMEVSFLTAMEDQWYLRIVPELVGFYEQDTLFGPGVHQAFPLARTDIQEAGTCLALERPNASVFHMMRAVEWGLRALCTDMGVSRLRSVNRKTGKVTYRRIEYSEWESILNQLDKRVEEKLADVRRGPKRQLYQEFYYPVLLDIRAIREAWRNHTMHTRSDYSVNDALAILTRVKHLMQALSSRLGESE